MHRTHPVRDRAAGLSGSLRLRGLLVQRFPVPRQQLGDVMGRMVGDAGKHIREPGARVDMIQPTRLDERIKHGGALPAGIAAAERPVPPSDGNAAH